MNTQVSIIQSTLWRIVFKLPTHINDWFQAEPGRKYYPEYDHKTKRWFVNWGDDNAEYDIDPSFYPSEGVEEEEVSCETDQNKFESHTGITMIPSRFVDKDKDETEVNIPAMKSLNVDAEFPPPKPGIFTFGEPAPSFEKSDHTETEVEILRRDLDDLRTDFDKVRRKLCRGLGDGFITKEEHFDDIKRPRDFQNHHGYCRQSRTNSFVGMSFKDYRAWRDSFEESYRRQQEERDRQREQERSQGVPSLEEEQIAKDRLETEFQRTLKIEHEAEKLAKLKAFNEAEAEAKAQKEHFFRTGEFITKKS